MSSLWTLTKIRLSMNPCSGFWSSCWRNTRQRPLSSTFVDARGCQQRGDQVLVSLGDMKQGSIATWPMVVTFIEGKHDLETSNLCEAIGQCQQRGLAILEQQRVPAVPPTCSELPYMKCLPKPSPPLHVLESGGIPDMVSQ
jgi:hypothetical protein